MQRLFRDFVSRLEYHQRVDRVIRLWLYKLDRLISTSDGAQLLILLTQSSSRL
jgi:hypothetical protein